MSPPNKEERERCWCARDAFWSCMDANKDDMDKCRSQRKDFEANCSNTWLKYFDRRRDYLKFKSQLEKGYEPIEGKS